MTGQGLRHGGVSQQAQAVSIDHRGQAERKRVGQTVRSRGGSAQPRPGGTHGEATDVKRQWRLSSHHFDRRHDTRAARCAEMDNAGTAAQSGLAGQRGGTAHAE